jgi:hypothetical protein
MCNGQVATSVVDTCDAPLITNIFANFGILMKWVLIGLLGARAKMIHEKTFSQKSRDTVPLILAMTIANLFSRLTLVFTFLYTALPS